MIVVRGWWPPGDHVLLSFVQKRRSDKPAMVPEGASVPGCPDPLD
jgi:hypothetical protein